MLHVKTKESHVAFGVSTPQRLVAKEDKPVGLYMPNPATCRRLRGKSGEVGVTVTFSPDPAQSMGMELIALDFLVVGNRRDEVSMDFVQLPPHWTRIPPLVRPLIC